MNPAINYFLERIQGFSTSVFRVETNNKTSATSSDIISVDLPQNAIVNLRSIKALCNINLDKGVTTSGARFGPVNTFVERVEVSIGGVTLSQGANFINVLLEAKRALGQDHCDSVLGKPNFVRAISYVDKFGDSGVVLSGTNNEAYTSTKYELFAIDCFEGFINSAQPIYLDTSLLSQITIRLYMASDNILTTSASAVLSAAGFKTAGTIGARYELTNIHFLMEVANMADATYDEMITNLISQQGFIEVPYKNYTSFQETHTGSTRFSTSASSLDRIWLCWRASAYNTQTAPVFISGYKAPGACVGALTSSTTTTIEIGLPSYDAGGNADLNTNCEKYQTTYFNFVEPSDGFKVQISLNSAFFPNFQAHIGELYGITKNSLPPSFPKQNMKMSMDQYRNNYCVQCFRFNMLGSENSRVLSGIDFRSSNASGIVQSTHLATPSSPVLNIFCESTEVLRIGAGRSLAIIS